MKKSEFETRRRAAWNVRMIRNLGTVNALIETDLEAAEAAGVQWDPEVEELGEIEVGRHCVLVRKGFDGLGALSLQEKEALCRWWNAGAALEGLARSIERFASGAPSRDFTAAWAISLRSCLAAREVKS